jgi:hypothetical protein
MGEDSGVKYLFKVNQRIDYKLQPKFTDDKSIEDIANDFHEEEDGLVKYRANIFFYSGEVQRVIFDLSLDYIPLFYELGKISHIELCEEIFFNADDLIMKVLTERPQYYSYIRNFIPLKYKKIFPHLEAGQRTGIV